MNETESTIRILDHIGKRKPKHPYSIAEIAWDVTLDDWDDARVLLSVGLYEGQFTSGFVITPRSHVRYDGFEFLEKLVEDYPELAARLAEPME